MRPRLAIVTTALVLVGAEQAGAETHLRVALAGQLGSRHDGEDRAQNGGGPTLRALWDLSARVRLGAMFDSLWYAGGSVEMDVTQQDLLAMAQFRLSPGAAFDVGVGMGRYQGRVDIPETPGCRGCGRYGDTTYHPLLLGGFTFSAPVARRLRFELSIHGVFARPLDEKDDVHNFAPPPRSWRGDAGLAVSF